MRKLMYFRETFEMEISDNVYKNIVDDIYNRIEDRFPTLPFRIALFRNKGHAFKASGYDYRAWILIKSTGIRKYDTDIYDTIEGFITKGRMRFRKRLDIKIAVGNNVDTYVYRSERNGVRSQEYRSDIIYDLKSGDYVEDVI